jgi:hypothetical protein
MPTVIKLELRPIGHQQVFCWKPFQPAKGLDVFSPLRILSTVEPHVNAKQCQAMPSKCDWWDVRWNVWWDVSRLNSRQKNRQASCCH